jgi:chemotaxis protein methyltransferase CheR
VRDAECVPFLQWALPRLRLRWAGYRKVRKQVCKRVGRRLRELGLVDLAAYEVFLRDHPDEWTRLDGLCRVTISRFYRDRGVFDFLREAVLPELARGAGERGVRCWSVGCASGEEPYTVVAIAAAMRIPVAVLATDSDAHLLERAREGIYDASSLANLPGELKAEAFEREGERFRLRPAMREPVRFARRDVRRELPQGPFELILCRNLVFTYFEEALQREVLAGLAGRLVHGGALVIGIHETLPTANEFGLTEWAERARIYRRR